MQMDSLTLDEEAEESTTDLRFSRVSSSEAFSESVFGLQWSCYPGTVSTGYIILC